jgi:hypothetical protein
MNDDQPRLEQAVWLLKRAAHLYEKYEARLEVPFNIFSTLRGERDEVNLHSRFLHALLNYQKSPDAPRQNLKSFLRRVVKKDKDFAQSGIEVERERDNIDILITNNVRQAVVIENKIGAEDQSQQLQRYHDRLREVARVNRSVPTAHSQADRYGRLDLRNPTPENLEFVSKLLSDEEARKKSVKILSR